MKFVINKNKKSKKKFPFRIVIDNNRIIPVPSQHNFKSSLSNTMVAALLDFTWHSDLKVSKKICNRFCSILEENLFAELSILCHKSSKESI